MKLHIFLSGLAALLIMGDCLPSAKVDFLVQVGDITYIKDEYTKEKRAAVRDNDYLWPNGVIPYNLTDYFTEKERVTILEAMRHWEDHTCIRFVPLTDRKSKYITLYPGVGCHSRIGRIKADQGVSLGRSCFAFRTVVHELGHVIGFYHEQRRPDRDEHVDIIYDNILQGAESQFAKLDEAHVQTGGVGYDYNSIMHYGRNSASRDFISDTIVAKDPNIPVGGATELSELDIVETNILYQCDAITPGPKTQVPVLPPEPFPDLPFECGDIFEGESGEFSSPDHDGPIECAWMIKVPEGYHVRIIFQPSFSNDKCNTDFIEVFDTLEGSGQRHLICGEWSNGYNFGSSDNVAYVHYVATSGEGAFEATFDTIDKDECNVSYCSHGCQNFPGGVECSCPEGYFLSADGRQCFDVNECALNAAGCDHICINTGGSYRCECDEGYVLESDERTCLQLYMITPGPTIEERVLPVVLPEPFPDLPFECGNIFEGESGEFSSPDHDGPIECGWMIRVPQGYHVRIIFRPSFSNDECNTDFIEVFDTLEGSGQRRLICGEWSNGYNFGSSHNVAYVHYVSASGEGAFEATFDTIDKNECNFGYCSHGCQNFPGGFECTCPEGYFLSGDGRQCVDMNECALNVAGCDHICINTGGSYRCECDAGYVLQSDGRTCLEPGVVPVPIVEESTTQPPTTTPTTPATTATTQPPTTTPTTPATTATTQPPTQAGCGGRLTTASGSLQSSNWPETYNVNEVCEWIIELPDATSTIGITFDDEEFGISGFPPDCAKDVLEIYDGPGDSADRFDSICGVILPALITTSSNVARIVFTAGPAHGSGRKGFKINYNSVAAPQPPPMIIVQTSPECENFLTIEDDSIIKTPNWPQTYPVNLHCEWLITVSDSNKVIEMSFDPQFGIAGRTDQNCPKDKLMIYDGHDDDAVAFGTFCELDVPPTMRTSSNKAKITFTALGSHGANRVGFKATAECI